MCMLQSRVQQTVHKASKACKQRGHQKSYWLLCCTYLQDCICLTHPRVYTHTHMYILVYIIVCVDRQMHYFPAL